MANIKQALGGTAVVTCTLASIASYASREATLVNNTVNLYLDSELMVKIQMSAIPNGDIWVLLSTSVDNTNIAYPATGTDAAIVIPQIDKIGGESPGQFHAGTDLYVLGRVPCPTSLTATGTVVCNFGSIAAILGGNLTPYWAPVFVNAMTSTFGTTTANHVIWYDGVYATSV
jgi:hypothetical protein